MDIAGLSNCFGCGKDNPAGLHLVNKYLGERSHMEFEVKKEYCGHPGLLHGGVTCLLFDEAMFWAIARLDLEVVTLAMAVDYKTPAFLGYHLICEAWVESRAGRHIKVKAVISERDSGKVIAEGKGQYLEVDLGKLLSK